MHSAALGHSSRCVALNSLQRQHSCPTAGSSRVAGSVSFAYMNGTQSAAFTFAAPVPGDIFAYCSHRLPRFHPISISGYHMQARRGYCRLRSLGNLPVLISTARAMR